jgi:hypothetical protein
MYYDTKLAVLYNIKYKNGGSLLHDIIESRKYKDLARIDLTQFVELYQKQHKVKIVTTIRNPKDAYFSGYNQIFAHGWMHDGGQFSNIHKNNIVRNYSSQLNKWAKKWETELPSYHFNDGHCAHYLWLTLSLIAGRCNLSIIKLEDYTEFLLSCYPECSDLILHADAKAKYGVSNIVKDLSLQAFENSIIAPQRGTKNKNTWYNWMSLELAAFDAIIEFLKSGKKQQVLAVLNEIAASDVYWKIPPNGWTFSNTRLYIKMIGKHNLPLSIVTRADTI